VSASKAAMVLAACVSRSVSSSNMAASWHVTTAAATACSCVYVCICVCVCVYIHRRTCMCIRAYRAPALSPFHALSLSLTDVNVLSSWFHYSEDPFVRHTYAWREFMIAVFRVRNFSIQSSWFQYAEDPFVRHTYVWRHARTDTPLYHYCTCRDWWHARGALSLWNLVFRRRIRASYMRHALTNTLVHDWRTCRHWWHAWGTLSSWNSDKPFSLSYVRHTHTNTPLHQYGVATMSRLLQIIDLFCKRAQQRHTQTLLVMTMTCTGRIQFVQFRQPITSRSY